MLKKNILYTVIGNVLYKSKAKIWKLIFFGNCLKAQPIRCQTILLCRTLCWLRISGSNTWKRWGRLKIGV